MPQVSVVIPLFNQAEFIEETLLSVANQTYKDWECIIVNDGSTDNSEEVVRNFIARQPDPLKYKVIAQENKGLPATRNIGIGMAEGKYILCLKPDTLVETNLGTKPIKSIQIGDLVKTHTGAFYPVIKIITNKVSQNHPIYWVSTKHSTIKATKEHPFRILRNSKQEWSNAEFITPKDYLLYPISKSITYLPLSMETRKRDSTGGKNGYYKDKLKINNIVVDNELSYFLGLYLAEGCTNTKNGITFCFNNLEDELHNLVKKVALEKFDANCSTTTRWATLITVNCAPLAKFFKDWFGANAKEKHIPDFIFSLDNIKKMHFLKGYLDGDGSFRQDAGYKFAGASIKCMEDLKLLCSQIGYATTKIIAYQRKATTKYEVSIKEGICYEMRMNTKNTRKFLDLLTGIECDNYIKLPISSVTKHAFGANKNMHVYNLEVATDNSFIASSAIVHNCLDSDDTIHPEMLERMARVLTNNPNMDIVGCDTNRFGEINTPHQTCDFLEQMSTGKGNMMNYCSMYRKSVWETVGGYDENIKDFPEDWDFWLSCLDHKFKLRRLPIQLFNYRLHKKSKSTRDNTNGEGLTQANFAKILTKHNIRS